ncbi:hypothetical protein TNCV_4144491 [Trichonephila clavipes]|nr:hypothetical protein TNCV_4144491 [Trichonephila clavipes]
MISSVHTVEMIEFENKKKEKKLKPKVAHDYNNTMRGVDKVDQHLTDYPVARLAGGVKNNMDYRIAIVEQNKPNVQLPDQGILVQACCASQVDTFQNIFHQGKKIYSNQTVFYMLS